MPIQPYASAVSLNLTLALVIANSTARAGAMPMPATNRVAPSQKMFSEKTVRHSPNAMTARRRAIAQRPIGMWPNDRPPARLPIENTASTIPASSPPWSNVATTPASTAAHAPISRNPITVASSTGGLARTLPRLRRLRGMRTRPTSGDRMNHAPPPRRIATMSSSACTVPTCVATTVITTGATIQMTSCSDASNEKSGVSWRDVTILG